MEKDINLILRNILFKQVKKFKSPQVKKLKQAKVCFFFRQTHARLYMMKKFFSALGTGICAIWNWIGKIILLLVKFFFWVWGAVLASILVLAIAFFLLSHAIKAFDQTQFSELMIAEMEKEMGIQNVPEISLSVENVELDTTIE